MKIKRHDNKNYDSYDSYDHAGCGCSIVAVILLFFIVWILSTCSNKEEEIKIAKIKADLEKSVNIQDLKFDEITDKNKKSNGLSYQVTGRLINQAKYKLRQAKLKIFFSDCQNKDPYKNCIIIDEQFINLPIVPADQARDIKKDIETNGYLKVNNHLQITSKMKIVVGEYDYQNELDD
ncbi:MAG: hypothetical protein DRQ51_06725 [Gammaproteobacteria bacterium]|nr:MAG: hypothetical protein DRQ51_06725 [Gammaproteobacteria bacterium]